MEYFDVSGMDESRVKKIVIFASYAPSLLLFRAHLIRSFLNNGCQVSILAPSITLTEDFIAEFKDKFSQVNILSIEMSLHGINPLKDFNTMIKIKKIFKEEQPDILLSYTIKPVIYGAIAASWARVPHVFAMITGLGTTFQPRNFKDRLIYRLVRILYRSGLKQSQKVFFQNPDDKKLFENLNLVQPRKTLQINGSGVDLEEFNMNQLPQKLSFIFIGRLLVEKGVQEFIQAAQKIHSKYPAVTFRVIGDVFSGHPRSISQDDLNVLKSESYFDFVGHVSDVRHYIQQSTIMVLPSYQEGTPRAVLEAMAMGRPIITTDAPGCRETVIDGVNGFLVPVKNVGALVEKMEYFIQNQGKCAKMGLASRKLAEEKFDVHQVNKVIINTILGNKDNA